MSTDDPTKGLGERCKHPSNPQAKHGFCAYLRSDRSHPEHFFSVFLSDGRAPQTSRAWENFPPLDGSADTLVILESVGILQHDNMDKMV